MPGRVRTSSEVEYEEGFPNSRVSSKVVIGAPDGDSEEQLILGRRPTKRQRKAGLDRRMSGMMHRANTSYAANLTTTRKRPRHASGSSSSVFSSEPPPRTPVDAIHERTRGKSLGEDFSLIKLGNATDRGIGVKDFLADDLPSWNDRRKEKKVAKDTQRREIPGWLSQTFVSLEPGHPLRALAIAKDQTAVDAHDAAITGANTQIESLESVQDNPVFAYQLVDAHDTLPEVPEANLLRDTELEVAHLHCVESCADLVEPTFEEISRRRQEVSLPEKQESINDSTSHPSLFPVQPILAGARSPRQPSDSILFTPSKSVTSQRTSYNPFATPGPASNFSIFASKDNDRLTHVLLTDEGVNDNTANHYSDPLTLVENFIADKDPFQVSTYSTSVIGEQHVSDPKPYSTPGPIFVAPPIAYFDSPTEDPADSDPAEAAYDDIHSEMEIPNTHVNFFTANSGPTIIADASSRSSLPLSSPLGASSNPPNNIFDFSQIQDTVVASQPPSSFILKTPPPKDSARFPYIHALAPGRGGCTNIIQRSSPLNLAVLSSPFTRDPGQCLSLMNDVVPPVTCSANASCAEAEVILQDENDESKSPVRKERPSFAPAPGIYLSPLKDELCSPENAENLKEENASYSRDKIDGNNTDSVEEPKVAKGQSDENIWNLSQASEDSIQSWAD